MLSLPAFQLVFEQGPGLCLLLAPGAPFTILAVTNAYLRSTGMRRDALVGKPLFDVFSDAPESPQSDVLRALRASLERVLATRAPDAMPVQRFDLPRLPGQSGELEARYWRPVNTPVVLPEGDVRCLIHQVEDVTAEVRLAEVSRAAEAQVRYERERLYAVFRQAPVAIAILRGPTYVIELANAQMCRVWGRALEQVLGRPVFEALPEAADQGFERLLDGVLATGVSYVGHELPVKIARLEGGAVEDVYFTFVYEPLRDPAGCIESVLAVATDVTEEVRSRRAAEARGEARLARFFDVSLDFLATASFTTGRWTSVNPAMTRALGFTRQELLDKPYKDIVHPDDLARSQEAGARMVKGEALVDFEHRVLCKDGSYRWVEWHATSNPEEGLFYCAGRDVTERHRQDAEREALLAREQAARAEAVAARQNQHDLFMQAPVPIAIIEGPAHVFSFANPAYRALVGGHDVVGKTLHDALPDIKSMGFDRLLDGVMATGEAFVGREIPIKLDHHVGDALLLLDFVYTPKRDAAGRVDGVLASCWDVTALVQARKQAEAANRLKDEFLATVSHELRTPLNAMLGWAQMLRSGVCAPEQRDRALATIERNARAQGQLIDDLLDVSRILAGQLRLEVELVELSPVVAAAIDVVRPTAEGRGIEFEAKLALQAPVEGDPHRLQQIIWNLLSNAVKFTPRGGRVGVSVAATEASVELVVTDSGQGIKADFLPHVFEHFRQADASTTRRHGGLGLGLAIVRQLVELHGGSVRAASEGEGRGATFTVRLPRAEAPRSEVTPLPAIPERLGPAIFCPPELAGLRVLVVDDDESTRDMLRALLEGCRAGVELAASAAEGLRRLEAAQTDVLLSDIGMPDEDGYAFVQKVRALPGAARDVPAVALTAYARAEERARALLAGFQNHVPKPIEPMELLAVVASLAKQLRHSRGEP